MESPFTFKRDRSNYINFFPKYTKEFSTHPDYQYTFRTNDFLNENKFSKRLAKSFILSLEETVKISIEDDGTNGESWEKHILDSKICSAEEIIKELKKDRHEIVSSLKKEIPNLYMHTNWGIEGYVETLKKYFIEGFE
jgi:hypothetical protein